jgi:diguanylate cyclase (GGDEF)-like protein
MNTSGAKPVVLLIETNTNSRNVVRDHLQRANFDVHVAPNAWEAARISNDTAFDVVVAEQAAPDNEAQRLRAQFLRDPATRDVPFIFLLPTDQTETEVDALRSGVDDCITRPFDPIVLVARVQAALQHRQTYLQFMRIDPLTRLLNHVTLGARLNEEFSRVQRYQRQGSLILIDVDDFKHTNQGQGYEVGDLLLTCLAGILLTSLRTVDVAGRRGSDEFVLFLPETPMHGAETLLKRIQRRVLAVGQSVAESPLSFSAAIVPVPEAGTDVADVYQEADRILDAAKSTAPGTLLRWQQS